MVGCWFLVIGREWAISSCSWAAMEDDSYHLLPLDPGVYIVPSILKKKYWQSIYFFLPLVTRYTEIEFFVGYLTIITRFFCNSTYIRKPLGLFRSTFAQLVTFAFSLTLKIHEFYRRLWIISQTEQINTKITRDKGVYGYMLHYKIALY